MIKKKLLTLTLLAVTVFIGAQANAAEKIIIDRTDSTGVEDPIPISLSGFSGEVLSTLQFDLYAMGFKIVPESQADFMLSGNNSTRVEGRLKSKVGGSASLLAKAYSGVSLRMQAHALADDVVKAAAGRDGIARTKIAYRVRKGARHFEIYVSDYDGNAPKAATSDSVIVAAPNWVKGRNLLFYSSYKNVFPDIVWHDLTTGKRQVFANYPGANLSPCVSPDGKKVAMILSRSGSPDLWVCDIDGKNLKQLTNTREAEASPTWSPDNRTICFSSEAGGQSALYTITTAGGAMKKLPGAYGLCTEPDWSPDGKTIAYTRQSGRNFSIYIVPVNGGSPREVATGEDPSWAGNSRNIMLTRDQSHLSVLDVPTKQIKDIARVSGASTQPTWSR
jgi:TolB protein